MGELKKTQEWKNRSEGVVIMCRRGRKEEEESDDRMYK
jgi:hypothetical protein